MSGSPLTYSLTPSDGPVTLFLHGFLGCGNDWDDLIARLGKHCRALRVDLPGHRRSCPDLPLEDYAMPSTAQLVIDVLDERHIDRCRLVGYSMGGRLGLYLLTHFPGRFDAAVIESASPGLRTEEERAARRADDAALARRLREQPFDRFLYDWYEQPLFGTIDRTSPRFEALLQRRRDHDPSRLALALERMGTGAMPSLREELPNLDLPVLFVAGERDDKFRRLADEMARLCPRARAAIIPDAGHNVHFERPEEYARTLIAFFDANL